MIKLEVENPNLFNKTFGISLIEAYEKQLKLLNKIFLRKENKQKAIAFIKKFEESGMPKA